MTPMSGDGHCIVHCFSSHFKEWMDQVLDRGQWRFSYGCWWESPLPHIY